MQKTLKLNSSFKKITPEQAQKILDMTSSPNRRRRSFHVKRLAKMMKEGRWENTGQGLIFDEIGNILDGQHRLEACVEAGVPIQILVVEGVKRENFKLMDRGLARNNRDDLETSGVPNAIAIAPMCPYLAKWFFRDLGDNMENKIAPGSIDYIEMVNENVDQDIVERMINLDGRSHIASLAKKSLFMAAAYVLYDVDKTKGKTYAEHFLTRLLSGEMLEADSPILVLRNRLMHHRSNPGAARLTDTCQFVFFFKAWNAFINGSSIKMLRFGKKEEMVWPVEVSKEVAPLKS